MSAGGVYQLLVNDGKTDLILLATNFLNEHLDQVVAARTAAGLPNTSPTLADIEQTHCLFVNAHFKPYVAIAMEYQRNQSQQGAASFGNTGGIQFSINQFGDFFSDMAVRTVIGSVDGPASTTGVAATVGDALAPTYGWPTTAVGGTTYRWRDKQGNTIANSTAIQNFVQYCDYPGIRLFSQVSFTVNGNPLDRYSSQAALMYSKFGVPTDKRAAFNTLVGQENPISGLQIGDTNVNGVNTFQQLLMPATDTSRRQISILNGPQTPKATQPQLEMYVPLRFWFNKDPHIAVPSVSIPYGQRYINIQTAPLSQILYEAPGNVYLEATISTLAAGLAVEYEQVIVPYQGTSNGITTPTLSMELFVNSLFVNPEIHQIYIERIGFNLIRVHLEQASTQYSATDSIQMSQFKWPIETIFIGFRPSANANFANRWTKYNSLTTQYSRQLTEVNTPAEWIIAGSVAGQVRNSFLDQYVYFTQTKTIDSLSIQAHGNILYQAYSPQFYTAYIPYTFGPNIVSNPDEDIYMVNFSLFPGEYQPSGHINISRAREFYTNYVSSYIDSTHPVEFFALAVAINFVLISDGSMVLRYTT